MQFIKNKRLLWQIRIFSVTWLAYFGFYFGRKNLSIANTTFQSEYGYTNADFAVIIGVYSLSYMIGQYLSGYFSDKYGSRLIVGCGLVISIVANLFFGFFSLLAVLLFLAGLNGLGQSTGWSGLIKNMSPWFRIEERGVVMSWWSTCYVVGGFMGTIFATYWLTNQRFWPEFGLKRVFWAPALLLTFISLIYILFTRNTPKDLEQKEREIDIKFSEISDSTVKTWGILSNSALWLTAIMYFFTKMTRYTYLFWLPTYLEQAHDYSAKQAGYTSSVYEFAGFAGIIFAGYLSDKVFKAKRFPVGSLMLFGLSVAFLCQPLFIGINIGFTAIGIGLIGFLTYGPDSLMSGATAMDIGTEKNAAKAAGFINGVGSTGQLLSPFLTAFISLKYGWPALFKLFIITTFISAILLAIKWNYKTNNN